VGKAAHKDEAARGQPAGTDLSEYVSGAQAAVLLGVKPQTLYTYVSRGAIQSLPAPEGHRRRLYLRADLEKLRSRPRARVPLGAVAASAMYAGDPIIPTSITEITPAGPCYRGRLASELASAGLPFENVAEFLWTGELLENEPVVWNREPLPAQVQRFASALGRLRGDAPIAHVFSLFALSIGMARGSFSDRLRSSSTVLAARQVIQAFAGCFGYLSPRHAYTPCMSGEPVAAAVLRACGIARSEQKLRQVNGLMVLLADHELSPATFAARVAASSGADLQACLVSAIETSSGRRIAEIYDRTEDFLSGARSKAELMRRLRELQAGGRAPPGFNQPIYPRGDPRAPYIFDLVRRSSRPSPQLDMIFAFLDEAESRFNLKPRMEFGVVALAQALGFPRRAASGLYILSRVAGWVAHVIEQRLSSAMLRPRAKFVE
jgi:citrate synthase